VRRGWHIEVGFASTDIDASLAPVVPEFAGGHVADLTGASDPSRFVIVFWIRRPGYFCRSIGMVLCCLRRFGRARDDAGHRARLESRGRVRPGPCNRAESHPGATPRTQAAIRASIGSPVSDSLEGAFGLMPGSLPGEFLLQHRRALLGLHTCNTWAAEVLQAGELPLRSPESCSRARFGGSSNGFSPCAKACAGGRRLKRRYPRTRRSCPRNAALRCREAWFRLAYHHRGARVLRHDYGGFRGGEGLLLLIHPPNIDAAISMLHRTFIIVSCEIAAISVHRESLQFGSGD